MLPPGDFDLPAVAGTFIHPWTSGVTSSQQWGPIAPQDTSQGLLHTLWTCWVSGKAIMLSSDTYPESVIYSHDEILIDTSLAFDQNGNLVIAFSDELGGVFLFWWDPTVPGYEVLPLQSGVITPRVTLDDARRFNVANSDVILMYSMLGALRYRLQRDRYTIEYTPLDAATNKPILADAVYHVSMMSTLRLGVIYTLGTSIIYSNAQIMKKQVLLQKAPVEEVPITFNFQSVMDFGEAVETCAVNIIVASGEDPNVKDMLIEACSNTDRTVTQMVGGGIPGVIYKISMSVRSSAGSVYVIEGDLYVNNSPAINPQINS